MATPPIPIKTSDGQAELNNRQRRLSQRHRTVLFLVDGRRNEEQVRVMAQQAGATDSCFAELVDMGLIALPQPAPPDPATLPTIPIAPPPAEDTPLHVDIPIDDVPPPPAEDGPESLLPAARSLHPESVLNDSMLGDSVLRNFDALEAARTDDISFEEARAILMRAVRAEAPVTGSLTMLRLRRARTRSELAELIEEVEARIIKPYRSLAAQQTLRRARHLLTPRGDPVLPAG
ncbi:hypothetical protein [Piscinibacter sp.]|uniref:hypothetical protein n=1 Tax=Piscinibacter sp. TaxID=1903157 RepID=UPI002CF7D75C|nr:hypothetical protein [Albitalea sp.]HUG21609.1 hypothetical protein [Albitalea sp.]